MGEALPNPVPNGVGFQEGHPKWGGRMPGTPNKAPVRNRVQETLDKYGVNPIEYLLGLLPKLQPNQQASVMQTLMLYTDPRPKEIEGERTPESSTPAKQATTGELLGVLRNSNDRNNASPGH